MKMLKKISVFFATLPMLTTLVSCGPKVDDNDKKVLDDVLAMLKTTATTDSTNVSSFDETNFKIVFKNGKKGAVCETNKILNIYNYTFKKIAGGAGSIKIKDKDGKNEKEYKEIKIEEVASTTQPKES